MGDQQDREAEFPLEFHQQVHDLSLGDDVQGGCGLVSDDQVGFARQGQGDHETLALPAGEFVGMGLRSGRVEAYLLEEFVDPGGDRWPVHAGGVQFYRLRYLVAYSHDGVEGVHGALEHHRYALPANGAHTAR
ncbi:hypothetical protein LUR56_04215 [Streptomyces sp. MT29]|nr:hypothetical protein [Streptomyces sp. MT29]